MGKKLVGCFLLVPVVLLAGCGLFTERPPLRRTIGPTLEAGDSWSIRVTYWPERFENPYVQSDTPIVARNHYSVLRSSSGDKSTRILVNSRATTALVQFYPSGNIEIVSRIIGGDTAGIVKTQSILSNRLQGGALFAPNWSPRTANFWFYPDMTARAPRTRMSFDSVPGRNRDWVVQTYEVTREGVRITLRHDPSSSRVVFDWNRGANWWNRARWYRSDRLIATARRVP